MFDTPADQKLETSGDHTRSKPRSEPALCLTCERAQSASSLYLALSLFYVSWHTVRRFPKICWWLTIGEHLCYWNCLGSARRHRIQIQKYADLRPPGLIRSALSVAALRATFSGMKYSQLLLRFGQQATDSFGERVKLWSCEGHNIYFG